jgi:hypothetical protein
MKTILGWIVLGLLTLAIGAGLVRQRWQATWMRLEIEPLRELAHDLERLRAENARLNQARLSAAEVAGLRAEQAEWQRLRAERETLQARLPTK